MIRKWLGGETIHVSLCILASSEVQTEVTRTLGRPFHSVNTPMDLCQHSYLSYHVWWNPCVSISRLSGLTSAFFRTRIKVVTLYFKGKVSVFQIHTTPCKTDVVVYKLWDTIFILHNCWCPPIVCFYCLSLLFFFFFCIFGLTEDDPNNHIKVWLLSTSI